MCVPGHRGRRLNGQEAPAQAPSSSSSDVSRLRLALLRLARRLRQNASQNPSQQSLLVVLDRFGDMTVGELASREGIQPPSVTRMVDSMEGVGLVRRYQVDGNRRSVYVGLTDDGRLAASRTHRERDEWLAARLARLDRAELAAVLAALPAMEKLLEDDGTR